MKLLTHGVPVSATQMWYGGLLNLDGQHDMDYYDLHFYGATRFSRP